MPIEDPGSALLHGLVRATHRTPSASRRGLRLAACLAVVVAVSPMLSSSHAQQAAVISPGATGIREAAWSPDGHLIAASLYDQIWIMAPDGTRAHRLHQTAQVNGIEREPAWSPDGRLVAFSANLGEGFDLFVASADGGTAAQVTSLPGDERWASWTHDRRLVFAHHDAIQWDLFITAPIGPGAVAVTPPVRLTKSDDDEMQPRVAPDGRRVVYVSNRDSEDGDLNIWLMKLAGQTTGPSREDSTAGDVPKTEPPVRVEGGRGLDSFPTWSPDSQRVAFYGMRDGVGAVWVAPAPADSGDVDGVRPEATPILLSRHGGVPAWSPDGRTVLISELPDPEPTYNGNPARVSDEPPPLFGLGDAFRLWMVPAPLGVDEGGRRVPVAVSTPAERWAAIFDRVWLTLRKLYYTREPMASAWEGLGAKYRPRALEARDESSLEQVLDELVAEQPLIKPAVTSGRAVVVSGHPLASQAGRAMLDQGGNIVDAVIAVSFALGVVEPDASGVGGDGMALLYLDGMTEPTVVDYKDQTPIHATADNSAIVHDGRLVADGPAAANIPGVVAGLRYLYDHYASGKLRWEQLIEPAIRYAEEGFVLDESLPTSIAEGRRYLEKYEAARTIFLPDGKLPRPGDRFVNPDYAATLKAIARGGAKAFYRGEIARRIADDMAAHGGIIRYADLAQYRAIERKPLKGHYRGHTVYSAPPPVSAGASLIESLQVLDHYTPRAGARLTSDPDYFHYLIEAWKVRDRIQVADPAHWGVDVSTHLDPAHALDLFRRIDPSAASPFPSGGEDEELRPPTTDRRIGRGTTAFAVGDAQGNLVAVTQTLSTWGGSFYVSKGLGFLYNNHLRSNRTAEGTYGQLLPLTRSSTASAPTLVFRQQGDRLVPRLAVGAAGNAWILASVYSVIAHVIDAGLTMQRAVEAPRFLVGRDPADGEETTGRIQIEDRIPRTVLEDLGRRGHRFQKIGRKGEVRYGYASAVLVDVGRGQVEGGADPRRSHAAAAASEGGNLAESLRCHTIKNVRRSLAPASAPIPACVRSSGSIARCEEQARGALSRGLVPGMPRAGRR